MDARRESKQDAADGRVRRLRAGDEGLGRDAARLAFGSAASRDRLAQVLRDPTVGVWVALCADAVVGAAITHVLPRIDGSAPMVLLYSIDVAPTERRRGIARTLIDTIEADAAAAHHSKLWLVTNASNVAAMRLYESAGLTRSATDDVVVGRRLPSADGGARRPDAGAS